MGGVQSLNSDTNAPTEPPNRRVAQKAATREALADAAIRLFSDQGFEETTVEEIARAAGVTERTFFLHFPTKEAAAFPDHDDRRRYLQELLGNRPRDVDPLDHLRSVAVEGVRISVDTRIRRPRLRLLSEVTALNDYDIRLDREYEEEIVAFLVADWGPSAEAQLRARVVANVVMSVARAALTTWAHGDIDPVRTTDDLLGRVLEAVVSTPLLGRGDDGNGHARDGLS